MHDKQFESWTLLEKCHVKFDKRVVKFDDAVKRGTRFGCFAGSARTDSRKTEDFGIEAGGWTDVLFGLALFWAR